jgi:DNA invertase Pin-like site-specific DNA recombinase
MPHTHPAPPAAVASDTRPVFGYVRVSTDQQETERQEQTLPARHASLPDGLSLNELELFYDHGISAWSGKTRPGFEEMFARIERREASALIIDTSSRLTRQGIREALRLFFTLQDSGCRLFTTTGKEYAGDLGGIISLIVDAEGDERYSSNLSHNVSTGKHAASSKGYWPHGKVPLGYEAVTADDNPERKVLAILEPEASAVREAFRLADEEHAPLREIGRYLSRTLGRSFDRTYARNSLLCNIVYIGKVRCDGKVYEGRHPALVSEERFERVQRRLALGVGGNPRKPRTSPFAGLVRCASCGRTLRYKLVKSAGRSGHVYPYLFCSDNSLANRCKQKGIRAEAFDATFAMMFGSLAFALRGRLDDDPDFGLAADRGGDLDAERKKLAELEERLEQATGLVLDGAIKRDDPRYQQVKTARDDQADIVASLSLNARNHREEIEAFVLSIEDFADLPEDVLRFIHRNDLANDTLADHYTGKRRDRAGDRFVRRVMVGWRTADLDTQRQIVERALTNLTTDGKTLTLHFRSAFPLPLTVPILADDSPEARLGCAIEGFGRFRKPGELTTTAALTGTAPR